MLQDQEPSTTHRKAKSQKPTKKPEKNHEPLADIQNAMMPENRKQTKKKKKACIISIFHIHLHEATMNNEVVKVMK